MTGFDDNGSENKKLLTLEDVLLKAFVDVIVSYLDDLQKKYNNIPGLGEFLDVFYQSLIEFEYDTPSFILVPYALEEKEKQKKQVVQERQTDITQKFKDIALSGPERINTLISFKEKLEYEEYLFLKGLLWSEESEEGNALLYLLAAIEWRPDNFVFHLAYLLLYYGEEKMTSLLRHLSAYPFEHSQHNIKSVYLYHLVKSINNLLTYREQETLLEKFTVLTAFVPDNISWYCFLRSMQGCYSPGEILPLVDFALSRYPSETSLNGLKALFLYLDNKTKEAYQVMQQTDIFNYSLFIHDLIELHVTYADLLRLNGEQGKALLELTFIVENEEYQMCLSNDYVQACFLLIAMHNAQYLYEDSMNIFTNKLGSYLKYLMDDQLYTWHLLMGDVHCGLKDKDKALESYAEAARIQLTQEIGERIEKVKGGGF